MILYNCLTEKRERLMNKKEYMESQNDCAKLLGLSLAEYNKSLKKIKCSTFRKSSSEEKRVKKILNQLGLTKKDLKKKTSKFSWV